MFFVSVYVFLLCGVCFCFFFFFSSRRRHTRCLSDWSSDVCSSDLGGPTGPGGPCGPAGPAGPCGPVATSIVTVLVGSAELVPSATAVNSPAPPASTSATPSSAYLLASLTILIGLPPYLDALVQRVVVLGEPLVTVRLGALPRPACVPGGGQHARDP